MLCDMVLLDRGAVVRAIEDAVGSLSSKHVLRLDRGHAGVGHGAAIRVVGTSCSLQRVGVLLREGV